MKTVVVDESLIQPILSREIKILLFPLADIPVLEELKLSDGKEVYAKIILSEPFEIKGDDEFSRSQNLHRIEVCPFDYPIYAYPIHKVIEDEEEHKSLSDLSNEELASMVSILVEKGIKYVGF